MLYPVGKLNGRRAAPMVIDAGRRRMSQNPAALSEFRARSRRILRSRTCVAVSGFSNHFTRASSPNIHPGVPGHVSNRSEMLSSAGSASKPPSNSRHLVR